MVDLGHWKLSLIQRWRAEGMVGFSLDFHLFCKVSSDHREDQTVRTVEGIVLRSFRIAYGNGLPYI